MKLNPTEIELLGFIYRQSGALYDTWPEALQLPRQLERLRTRNLIRRKDYPLRYFLTRQGYSLAASIHSLREQPTFQSASASA